VSRPITKLLSGIDDVAKGDLSHVILSERDDEIGQIATRFNEMTFSLRESRGETLRQNEAKLALEQRLGQTEKLATIGQLAAEIAHEVGTPLNVIAGRAKAIKRKSKDAETVEKNAEIVAEQTARITRIIQRLLDFTRRKVGTTGKAEVNVNELSLTTMELLSGQFSAAKIKTRLERAEGLPRVAGDADRLQQVLINLMLNAVQAMPDGGSLAVSTRSVKRTRPGLEEGAEQDFVEVSVKDSGIGIPEDIRDKVFDPFYTTKEGQGGTGLGLAVCSGIVKEHDGWIDIESNSSGGTVFHVYLPA
jgi:signal transduction histidine kinase